MVGHVAREYAHPKSIPNRCVKGHVVVGANYRLNPFDIPREPLRLWQMCEAIVIGHPW